MLLTPRPKQKEVLAYRGGRMSVLAVPGSGKTWTLSLLAANLIAEGVLEEDQEVLVVTLTNSAVDNFTSRIGAFLREMNAHQRQLLLPDYRVCTLHSLSHDIVRRRPDLLGLAENFQIVDEREAEEIITQVATAWLRGNPDQLDHFLSPELDENKRAWVVRDKLPKMVGDIGRNFIRYAKDLRLTVERLQEQLATLPLPLPLAEMGVEIYAGYQQALAYRGAVDFDDLNRLALDALEADESLLERLQAQWPYILEDEAQDSSRLQEQILSKLAGPGGNWVRVGDPNQAIYETFTTANPEHLRQFHRRPDVLPRTLPNSGRSTPSIITLANTLVEWTRDEHPLAAVRDALDEPLIQEVPEGEQGSNPPDAQSRIYLSMKKYSPAEEVQVVAQSAARWIAANPTQTVAVLAPRNMRGFEVADALRRRGTPVNDSLLQSSGETRTSAGALGDVLAYLADPGSARKLARVYQVWQQRDQPDEVSKKLVESLVTQLRRCPRVEDYLWPEPGRDWLESLDLSSRPPAWEAHLREFRQVVRRWQGAVLLPVDQIVLTLAQDLFSEQSDLALAHKLAVLLRRRSETNPDWQLPELIGELDVIARNARRFLGFAEDDTGFDPAAHAGEVVVGTMHKAKGLEWDRVYLMSVNNYDFPSGQSYDTYIAERWFVRDNLNLEAEALAQLEALLARDEYDWYREGRASQTARLDYVRERLRLLYVGITRARRELIITWNTGKGKTPLRPAEAFTALHGKWRDFLGAAREEDVPD